MADSLSTTQCFELIDEIQAASMEYNLFPFGGSERDRIQGVIPKDLDFYQPTESYAHFKPTLKKLIRKLRKSFQVRVVRGKPDNYALDVRDLITCEFTSIQHPTFSICADFVSGWHYTQMDVDVNSLRRTPSGVLSNTEYSYDEIVENIGERQFHPIMSFREGIDISTFKSNGMLNHLAIKAWIKGDHRLIKLLNTGWTPVCKVDGKPSRHLKNATHTEIIEALGNMGYLTVTEDGVPLMFYAESGVCASCDLSITDEYVYRLNCCQKLLHSSCAIKLIWDQADYRYINCTVCNGDPFGRGTSGIVDAPGYHTLHMHVKEWYYCRYLSVLPECPAELQSLTCGGHSTSDNERCHERMITALKHRVNYYQSRMGKQRRFDKSDYKCDIVQSFTVRDVAFPDSVKPTTLKNHDKLHHRSDTITFNLDRSLNILFIIEHGIGVVAEYVFDSEAKQNAMVEALYYRANGVWIHAKDGETEHHTRMLEMLDSNFKLNRKLITYVLERRPTEYRCQMIYPAEHSKPPRVNG